jgi:ribosomal protein L11 methyltransferase
MGAFWQLSFDLGQLDPNTAEALCFDLGAASVTFVDAHDDPVLEPLPGEFRLWPTTRLRVLFVGEVEGVVSALSEGLNIQAGDIAVERVEDRAWEREWLRDFHAMRFGRRLWISPHHEEVAADDAVIVRMDPGLAFGTGTHPTTAMCLEWLDRRIVGGECVIDFGCGSGVLAVAAVKLGAGVAHCFDIDPQALLATRQNADANGVAARISVHEAALELPLGSDVLVANILSGPLCELAATFATLVRDSGWIVLAGLLEREIADVTQAYGAWFDMHPFEVREGWAGLAGKRDIHAARDGR